MTDLDPTSGASVVERIAADDVSGLRDVQLIERGPNTTYVVMDLRGN